MRGSLGPTAGGQDTLGSGAPALITTHRQIPLETYSLGDISLAQNNRFSHVPASLGALDL